MPLITAAIIGGVATAASGYMSAQASAKANERNVSLARENRDVQVELANTAHQREMADLKAAGLNPILSAKYGGASVPTSSAASVQPEDYTADVGKGISSAVMARAQLDLIKEQTRKTHHEGGLAADQEESASLDLALKKDHMRYMRNSAQKFDESGELSSVGPSDFNERVWQAQFERDAAAGRLTEAQLETARQAVLSAVQERNIGASAEARAKVMSEIYRMGGEKLMQILKLLNASDGDSGKARDLPARKLFGY